MPAWQNDITTMNTNVGYVTLPWKTQNDIKVRYIRLGHLRNLEYFGYLLLYVFHKGYTLYIMSSRGTHLWIYCVEKDFLSTHSQD